LSEAARADCGGNRRRPDAHDRSDADAGDDRGQRQRQLHEAKQFPRRHAHRHARLSDGGSNPIHPRQRCADDWQQAVQNQHDDGRARADAAKQRDRQQKAEHGQARDGLDDVRQCHDWHA